MVTTLEERVDTRVSGSGRVRVGVHNPPPFPLHEEKEQKGRENSKNKAKETEKEDAKYETDRW